MSTPPSPRWTRRWPGPLPALMLIVLGAGGLLGCDDETVGPDERGNLVGTVLNAETDAPVAQANVTTSPPTQSILTDDDGRFAVDGVEAGSYSVTATKSDFESRSVSVQVREGEPTDATILLRPEDGATGSDSLTATVTNWFNDRINRDSTGPDSIFAEVQYRAENAGDVRIGRYELTVEIETAEDSVLSQAQADSLAVGEVDVGSVRRLVQSEAQTVTLGDIFFETEE
ncbi:carboxypeptidase-like regulatory domain-containing protein [Salinibacter altiplanensis]|uniref:carboxypeptidase-like regulatory domain-containing protein n=1 Tax=Salinibacter altiplanensis TaxID=1803181 RepID=UPI001F301425|nr:carboxypeptidase-like regulatory domain-containing protein [Salinibacter altiplanensis]